MHQLIDNASVIEGLVSASGVQTLPNRPDEFTSSPVPPRDSVLVRSPWIVDEGTITPNRDPRTILKDQNEVIPAPLVRPLSVDVSSRYVKVRALQRWTGRVERVLQDRFVAIIRDITSPENPEEEVELDIQEVSGPDRSMVAPGAIFYWSIVYRDTRGGQRERLAILRFARQPKLSQTDVEDIYSEADRTADLLQSA